MDGISEQVAFQERVLVREEAARDTEFAALVERQARFVFRVAYSILRNVQDAEDVVQETFLKLYRSRAWERIADEKAFLARAAWRIAVDQLNKRPKTMPDWSTELSTQNPEQAAIASDRNVVLHRLIDGLPEELRQPLVLSGFEEFSSREIAEIMGIPEGTVRTRLLRARQILRQKLAALKGGRDEER